MPKSLPSFDVLAIGDTMLDVFVEIQEAAVHCALDQTACRISFSFGEKIPVEAITKLPAAGNASNAALAAARLGGKTAICSTVGNDFEAGLVLARWKDGHVDARYVIRDLGNATNYSTVLSFKGERTILVHHNRYAYRLPTRLPAVKRIYYTSLGEGHEPFEQALLSQLQTMPTTRLTFQPGTYQLRRFASGTKEVLARTDILVLNKEEAAAFLQAPSKEPLTKCLERLQACGPRLTVITDGEHGSYALEGGQAWFCPPFPVPCRERTGAGDAYASAFTWAIDQGFGVPEAMRHGTANAASVIQFVGPHAGLLDREGLNRLLRKFAHLQPTPLLL